MEELVGRVLAQGEAALQAVRLRDNEASVYASFLASVPAEESDDAFCQKVDSLT